MSTVPSQLREMTSHNNLHSLLFQATSAEYIALCVQTYQLARHAVRERLAEGTYRNPAIVFDLDETVLDNSAFQKWLIETGKNFDEGTSWKDWCDAGQAGAVPGAVEFVRFAVDNCVDKCAITPLFITSRENRTRSGTAKNLFQLGLISDEEFEREMNYLNLDEAGQQAHAKRTRLFMKGMPSTTIPLPNGEKKYLLMNKFDQRVFCERVRGYEILLSIGDSLGDYAEYYGHLLDKDGGNAQGHPSVQGRRSAVWQDIRLFGREFILVPNATYGSWLRALEANGIGASDELAATGAQVREGLNEPQQPFNYGGKEPADAKGKKLDAIPGDWNP